MIFASYLIDHVKKTKKKHDSLKFLVAIVVLSTKLGAPQVRSRSSCFAVLTRFSFSTLIILATLYLSRDELGLTGRDGGSR